MKGIFITTPSEVNNPDLFPKMDEIRMKVTKRGSGVAKITISSIIGYAKLVFIGGIGKFYSDPGATQLIGTEWLINGNRIDMTIYAKVDSDGFLAIETASDLNRLGRVGDFNSANAFLSDVIAVNPSFTLTLNSSDIAYLSQFRGVNNSTAFLEVIGDVSDFSIMLELEVLIIRSTPTMFGDANFLKYCPNLKAVSFTSPIKLDLNNLMESVYCMSFPLGANADIMYTGTSLKKFNYCTYIQIQPINPLSTTETDNLIISMSQSDWRDNKVLNIRGTRTVLSDSAVATLQGKGVTLTLID